MTSDPRYNHLREQSWLRNLTRAEEAELRVWLSTHPDAQLDFEADAALTQSLEKLPDVPVSSNFTARVLRAVEREDAAKAREPRAGWRAWLHVHRWLPRVAAACLVIGVGLASYGHHHHVKTVQRIGRSLESVSAVRAVPSPDILQDFEAVRAISRTGPDEELLAALQ